MFDLCILSRLNSKKVDLICEAGISYQDVSDTQI